MGTPKTMGCIHEVIVEIDGLLTELDGIKDVGLSLLAFKVVAQAACPLYEPGVDHHLLTLRPSAKG